MELAYKRHTLAHLLGAAVMELYPGSKLTLGPAVDDGFYYDVDPSAPIREVDLEKIQSKMLELLPSWRAFSHREVFVQEALDIYIQNEYKSELIDEINTKGEKITLYTVGTFTDLCRGGHCENPAVDILPGSWKLDRIAGAYWRGDEKNKMLTRIYGLAFNTAEELEKYTWQQEEAKKRDHRKLGKELGLFIFSELVGPGLPLWTPKGTMIREELQDFVWELRKKRGYQKVVIPHITKQNLYEKSGHWAKYADDLFKINTREKHVFAMKPMNCPHHTQIFDSEPRSYRNMPQRYCESTMVYRDEQSGELSGLSRVISITQDDAHVFCRINQIEAEAASIWDIIAEFYSKFGFVLVPRLSRRDPATPDKYLGSVENWDLAETMLKNVITKNYGNDFVDGPGEAAFYGPKIDFMASDAIGRKHQIATIQLDFVQPERFELSCVNERGEKESIAMFHCAIMGSFERFLSVAIEHFAGAFPVWLSPVQVAILPVSEKHTEYAEAIQAMLRENGVRVELMIDETLGKRIRESKLQKIPYQIVVGDKEVEGNVVTVEGRNDLKLAGIAISEFVERIVAEVKNRTDK